MIDYQPNIKVLNQIDKHLRRFSFSSKMEILRVFHHASEVHLPNNEIFKDFLTGHDRRRLNVTAYNHEFAYLSLVSIIKGEWNGYINDMDFNSLKKAIKLYRNYNVPFVHEEDHDLSTDEIVAQFAVRTGLQQFVFQKHPFNSFYRYNFFFNYENEDLNIKELFEKEFVYSYEDYLLFSWTLYVFSYNSKGFNVEELLDLCENVLRFSRDKIIKMINLISISRKEFQELYDNFSSDDFSMRVYDFNPLLSKPLIEEDSNIYFPAPFTIFTAITEGFYQKLCTTFGLNFKRKFGKYAFEDFVEHLLKLHNYDYIKEFEYSFKKNRVKSPDFILFKNDHMIFLELKARTPMISLRTTNMKEYQEEISKSLGASLAQCYKKEAHMKSGYLTHSDFPKNIKRISHIALTLEDFNIVHDEGIEAAIIKQGAQLSDSKYHTMSTNTLESILEEDDRDLFEYCMEREEKGTYNKNFSDADVIRSNPENKRDYALMKKIVNKLP